MFAENRADAGASSGKAEEKDSFQPVGRRPLRAAAVALLALALLALVAGSASAHRNPSTCDASAVGIGMAAFRDAAGTVVIPPGGGVLPGEVVYYRTTLFTFPMMGFPGLNFCSFGGGPADAVTLTLPDGTTIDVAPAGTVPHVTSETPFSTTPFPYVVAAEHAGPNGQLLAETRYLDGISHTGGATAFGVAGHSSVSATAQNVLSLQVVPASCNAYALRIETLDPVLVPGAVTSLETFSASTAAADPRFGKGHGDAQQAGVGILLPTVTDGTRTVAGSLSTGALTSSCDAESWDGRAAASGHAETEGIRVDLSLTGVALTPITFNLDVSVLVETGESADADGAVEAKILDVKAGGLVGAVPYGGTLFTGAVQPNTRVDLTVPTLGAPLEIGYLVLNAQDASVDGAGCATDTGSALKLFLYDLTGLQVGPPLGLPTEDLVRITVSHVSVSTCPDAGPGGRPEGEPLASCSAAGILVDASTSRLSATPWGAFSGFSRSSAERFAPGSGFGSARQVDVDVAVSAMPAGVPTGTLHVDDITSACGSEGDPNGASGEATINHLDLDLDVNGVQLAIQGRALHTELSVLSGVGATIQDFVGYTISVDGTDVPVSHQPAPNSVLVDVAGVKVIANEQVSLGGCAFESNALVVRIYDPLLPTTLLLEIKIGHVTAAACAT